MSFLSTVVESAAFLVTQGSSDTPGKANRDKNKRRRLAEQFAERESAQVSLLERRQRRLQRGLTGGRGQPTLLGGEGEPVDVGRKVLLGQ